MTQPDVRCPTCGPTTSEQHPRLPVSRCTNCKEHLPSRDVLAWLENAISERERSARAADEIDPSPWVADAVDDGDTDAHRYGHGYGMVKAGDGNDLWKVRSSAHAMAADTSRHVAMNDPEAILRCCAADRKLLELHGGRGHGCPAYDYDGDLDEFARFYNHEACPVVQHLAMGYGWTEGE